MKSKYLLLGIIGITLLAAGCQKKTADVTPAPQQEEKPQSRAEENKMMDKKSEGMMKKDESSMQNTNGMMQKQGYYKDYSVETLAEEQKAGQKVVLYFYAVWCPFCKAADAAFKANPEKIPAGITVLKTDYDTEKDLKTKYGVTYQHTFVQIDSQGNQVTKWNSGDIDLLKANIK